MNMPPSFNSPIRFLLVFLLIMAAVSPAPAGRRSLKRYDSPDKSLMAIVMTVNDEQLGPESNVELRTAAGALIGLKRFTSKDHVHGFGVIKAKWSLDSRFFVFSTVASGGREAGKFPTFFFSRIDKRIHPLDPAVGKWITDPEFYLQEDDVITVTVYDTLANGVVADTLSRTVHLSRVGK